VAIVEVVPASFPENIWRVATITATTRIPPGTVLDRLEASTRRWSFVDWFRAGTGEFKHHVRAPRFRLWRSTYFRNSPYRGALVLDAAAVETGVGTQVRGEVQFGAAFAINLLLFSLIILVVATSKPRPGLAVVFAVAWLIQFAVFRALAARDVARIRDVVRYAVDDGEAPLIPS
jgi:hypothetical protein